MKSPRLILIDRPKVVGFASLPLVGLAFLVAGVVGCSSNAATAEAADAAVDDPCTALAACCATIGGPGETACLSSASAARESGTVSTCAATLQSYTQGGLCGGEPPDAGAGANLDATAPCALTGSCPSGNASPGPTLEAGATVPEPTCSLTGTCVGGLQYYTCTEFTDAGACVAAIVFSEGVPIPCASCLDCAAASASAAAQCANETEPLVNAGFN